MTVAAKSPEESKALLNGHKDGQQAEVHLLAAKELKEADTAPFAKVHIIRDNKYVYTVEPKKQTVEFTWRDEKPEAGKPKLLRYARRTAGRRDRPGFADVDHLSRVGKEVTIVLIRSSDFGLLRGQARTDRL